MPEIQHTSDDSRRQTAAQQPIAVPPRVAGEMLGYGKTKIFRLLKEGQLRSFTDGSRRSRRILVSSIRDFVERRLANSDKA